MRMSQSWIEQLEKGWGLLRENNNELEVERFYRSALTAFRSKAVDAPGLAVIANRMLESPLEGAPYLGRKMLEQAGTRAFPVIGSSTPCPFSTDAAALTIFSSLIRSWSI
jgi:hypothetical protein